MIILIQLSALSIVAYQDFKSRSVDLMLLIILFIALLASIPNITSSASWSTWIYQNTHAFLIITLITVYHWIVRKNKKHSLKKLIGMGDLVLMIILILNFKVQEFLLILIVAGLSGIIHGCYLSAFKNDIRIPFCSHLSLVTAFLILNNEYPKSQLVIGF